MSFNCSRSTLEFITDWFTMMLTSFPTYSLYKSSYTYNFLNRITLSFFLFSPVIQISIAFCILFSVLASIRIICCQRYIWPLSKYFWMLVASSQTYQPFPEYLRRSPVKSFTGLWHLWNQIIQLMQFSRYKREFFEYPFTYYSLETPKCCSLQKNPLTNKALQRHFWHPFLKNS